MKPVSKTAYFCCGVRMTDAERRRPLCGDHFAKRFFDAEARAFYEPFASDTRAVHGNAARHRIIDDLLRERLDRDPALPIFTVGAGFDSRPYRLRGGSWLEIDEPAIIELKNARLPLSESPNRLTRIAIDFERESVGDKLAPYRTQAPCIFVFEGVFMYLEQSVVSETVRSLRAAFPRYTLICDLMLRSFVEKHTTKTRARIEQFGALFRPVDNPYAVFAEVGLRLERSISVVQRSVALRLPRLLSPLARLLPRELREGYTVNVFDLA